MTIHYLTDTWPWFDARQCYGRSQIYLEFFKVIVYNTHI
jgi:hypothetical protein